MHSMDPHSIAAQGTPRLQKIHQRYLDFTAGLEGSLPTLSPESSIWAEKMDEAMSVFDSELRNSGETMIELQQRLNGDRSERRGATSGDDDEEELAKLGRQPAKRTPHAPQPIDIRNSLPSGQPIRADERTQMQANKFNLQHKMLSTDAYRSLLPLVAPGNAAPYEVAKFHYQLEELKRHRFQRPPEEAKAAATKTGRHIGPKAQDASVWKLQDSIWKDRPKWSDSKSFHDTPEMWERAFSLDWSRALRSHKLASFIMRHDDGDSDDEDDDHQNDVADAVCATRGADEDTEIVEVGSALWKHHLLLYRTFDAYASLDTKSGISGITYNAYKDVRRHAISAETSRPFIRALVGDTLRTLNDDRLACCPRRFPPGYAVSAVSLRHTGNSLCRIATSTRRAPNSVILPT